MRNAIALLGLCALLAGCGGGPPLRYFSLDPVAGTAPAPAKWPGPPLQVSDITLPGAIDRQSIVTRGPGNRVDISDRDQWAAPMEGMIRSVLTRDLAERLPPGSVLAPGEAPPEEGARKLVLSILEFSGGPGAQVVLQADWTLSPGGRARHILRGAERITVPEAGRGGEALASAMSRALAELADRIAGRAVP